MTAAAKTPSVEYLENGVTTAYAAKFRFFDPTHLLVERISAAGIVGALAYGSDYAVTGGTTDAGGTVTVTTPAAVGVRLRIRRVTPRSQEADYTTNDTFPAETHEGALDKTALIDQEQDVAIDDTAARALLVPDGESVDTLPAAADRAGKFLGFGGGGEPVGLSGTGADAALRTDLAASTGGALVGLSQPASTVPFSLSAWVRRTVSAFDGFGVQGDGIADESVAVNYLVENNKGRTIVFPDGDYQFAGLILSGASYAGTRLVFEGRPKLKPAANTTSTNFQNAFWAGIVFHDVARCGLELLDWFDGQRLLQPNYEFVHCVVGLGVQDFTAQLLQFREIRADGMMIIQKTVGAASTNSDGLHFGKIVGKNNSADDGPGGAGKGDGRNTLSIISGDNGSIESLESDGVGGLVGGYTMPGGLDFEADNDYQSIKGWEVGQAIITYAGSSGFGCGGKAGFDVTRDILVGELQLICTATPHVADGNGNITLCNHTLGNLLYCSNVRIDNLQGRYINAYGSGLGVTGCDDVYVKGQIEHVWRSDLIFDDAQAVGSNNVELDITAKDIARYGSVIIGEANNPILRGRKSNPVSTLYGARYAVAAIVAQVASPKFSVDVVYSADWTQTYRNDGSTFTDPKIRDCEMVGPWPQGTALYGNMGIPFENVGRITDQPAVPVTTAGFATGQYVRNNSGTSGQPTGWTRTATPAWVAHANLP